MFKSNWDLSAARAISVVQYLIGKGVSPQRLVAAGFGEFQPIDLGKTEDAYQAQSPHRVQADRTVSEKTCTLRPYTAADEDAAIELWRRTWAKHYPHLDFNARVPWWRERWRKELVPVAADRACGTSRDKLVGFVTVDPKTVYLDQIVVAPEHWGSDVALACLRRPNVFHRMASTFSSTRTIFALSDFMKSTASSMPEKTKIRCRE